MLPMPPELTDGLSEPEIKRTRIWWLGLSLAEQAEFAQAYHARADDGSWYATVGDGELRWHRLPVELVGHFVDPEDRADHDLARQQLLEFVSNHEEIAFFLVEGAFHICRAHPSARAVIRQGFIPADFECPLSDAACPMRRILAVCPGRAVQLDVRVRR